MADGATAAQGRKRRILFIEKAFQIRFIAKVTAVVVAGTALTGGLLYLLADREFGRVFYSAHYQARSSWEILLPAVLVSSFVAMCLVAGLAVVFTLYDSHRIGGPLYRFRANLRDVGQGNLCLVTRLREGDELQAFTEAMNEMTRGLRSRMLEVRREEERLRSALVELRGELTAGGESGPAALARAEEIEADLRRALGEFRVEP